MLVVVLLVVLTIAGLAVGFFAAARPPSPRTRDRISVALLVVLALVPVGIVTALALSDKGLGGSVERGWEQLTDPSAALPINDPSRLTAAGSVRARYWDEALQIFRDNPGRRRRRRRLRDGAQALPDGRRRGAPRPRLRRADAVGPRPRRVDGQPRAAGGVAGKRGGGDRADARARARARTRPSASGC